MIPGNADLLKCPLCGGEKEVMSLMSGNTCGGRSWSDTKVIYPMLPRLSPIQKCPSCGKYYFTNDAEMRESDSFSFEEGNLTYEQLKEAAIQFNGLLSEENKKTLNIMLLWAYNDKYNREGYETAVAPEEEKKYIYAVLEELIATDDVDDIVKAEYYREMGRFKDALELLETCHPSRKVLVDIVERMKSYAQNNDPIAFRIQQKG